MSTLITFQAILKLGNFFGAGRVNDFSFSEASVIKIVVLCFFQQADIYRCLNRFDMLPDCLLRGGLTSLVTMT